jgi:hypothetical protein
MLFPALTAAFGLFGTILSAVAIGLPNWSRFEYLTATSENTIGLWTLPDNTYCQGWVIATAAMMICALICFFLVLFGAALILCSKVAWKTRSLRILVSVVAFFAFVFSLLAVIFWICFHEWNKCWLDGQNLDVNAYFKYQKYDASWILACVATGLAMLMTCTACAAIGKMPRQPVKYVTAPPYMPAYAPPTVSYTSAPKYPVVPPPTYPSTSYTTAPAYSSTTSYTTSAAAPAPAYTTSAAASTTSYTTSAAARPYSPAPYMPKY